jgi:hypothetical protein
MGRGVAQAGLQQFCDKPAACLPSVVQFLPIDEPDDDEDQQTNQRANPKRAAGLDDELRRERRHLKGKIVPKDGPIYDARSCQRRHQGHQPPRAAQTALIALDFGNLIVEFTALGALVISDAPPQEGGSSFVFAWHRSLRADSGRDFVAHPLAGPVESVLHCIRGFPGFTLHDLVLDVYSLSAFSIAWRASPVRF